MGTHCPLPLEKTNWEKLVTDNPRHRVTDSYDDVVVLLGNDNYPPLAPTPVTPSTPTNVGMPGNANTTTAGATASRAIGLYEGRSLLVAFETGPALRIIPSNR